MWEGLWTRILTYYAWFCFGNRAMNPMLSLSSSVSVIAKCCRTLWEGCVAGEGIIMILRFPLLGRIAVIPVLLTDIPGQGRTFRPALLYQQPMDCRYSLRPFEAQRTEQLTAKPRSCQKALRSLDSLPLPQ